ncbi:MBL fold metallo-hydrolase [Allosphingosinicella sp.]|uniref:MBL fold metallo-hydrolase n=1 Tax=Allosphingosinicella sp. TaxID=2823234 RepID=UPI002F1E1470
MVGEVTRVRMYRGILGDCFLLRHSWTAEDSETKTLSILIDCGVLQGVERGRERMVEIAADVARECDGKLDVVVVTHEHADHLSGFAHARDIFFHEQREEGAAEDLPRLDIGRLWLAWTEDDQDPRAQELRAKFHKVKAAIDTTAKLAAFGLGEDERIKRVMALQKFIGFDDEEPGEIEVAEPARPRGLGFGAAPAAGPGEPAVAEPEQDKPRPKRWTGKLVIEKLKSKAGAANIDYLEPGDIVRVAPGLSAYVLGPPRDEKRLRKDTPSGGSASEVYLAKSDEAYAVESAAEAELTRKARSNRSEALAASGQGPAAGGAEAAVDAEDPSNPSPFPKPYRRRLDSAEADGGRIEDLYFKGPKERRIENDWLDAAEALALKMDSDTNNTSLVLAFERDDRQVLLFAADAQVGNWLSWADQTYPREAKEGEARPIAVDGLLKRVTLYKVGHHASHNATLKGEGLEKMTDPRLTAMIPVVEAVAKAQGKEPHGWRMPYPKLEQSLLEKTQGRVIRGDNDHLDREKGARWGDIGVAYQDPAKGGLWVELTFADGTPPSG